MRVKLTPAFIAKATANGKHQAVYWDAAMPGFGLMVTPAGHKSFVVQYRADGKSRRATIKFGPGLDAARREARALQGSVARGGDPVGEYSTRSSASKGHLWQLRRSPSSGGRWHGTPSGTKISVAPSSRACSGASPCGVIAS